MAVESGWGDQFAAAYRMTVAAACRLEVPWVNIVQYHLRSYTVDEIDLLATQYALPVNSPEELGKVYPGSFAILRELAPIPSIANAGEARPLLIIAQLQRWVSKHVNPQARQNREILLSVLGGYALDQRLPASVSDIFVSTSGRITEHDISQNASGPLILKGHQVSFRSRHHADVAAARSLLGKVGSNAVNKVARPVPTRVIDHAVSMVEAEAPPRNDLKWTLEKLRGREYEEIGYYACALAAISLKTLRQTDSVRLAELYLQGPPHDSSNAVLGETQADIRSLLTELMRQGLPGLIARLSRMPKGARSCNSGSRAYWIAARQWAGSLKLRAKLEQRISEELSPAASWRYEDILDVSVTEATTVLLIEFESHIRKVIAGAGSSAEEIFADLWDGFNDGCWDQVIADRSEYIDALVVPEGLGQATVVLRASHLQRARFGNADLSGWSMESCDLHLADLRSCTGVLAANLSNSNWWTAMLAPDDRYALSRIESHDQFMDWCADPPWCNPYYASPWPLPFGGTR